MKLKITPPLFYLLLALLWLSNASGYAQCSPAAGDQCVSRDLYVQHDFSLSNNLILPVSGWAFNSSPNGSLYVVRNWDFSSGARFSPDGVSFQQKVAIGDVSCPSGTTCAGPMGLNNMTLAVGGRIGARGGVHVVNFGAAWPDYVFAPGYPLMPLADVARYVAANHHLPDVPSAEQVQTEGVELASLNAVLLRKVEELTLHLIKLEQANQALSQRVTQLEAGK